MPPSVLKMDDRSIAEAAKIVEDGGLVVFPTDTVYGLGCDPENESALSRLFESKRRESKPVPVLCSNQEKAEELVDLGELGKAVAKRFWPGAITIVAPLKRRLPVLLNMGSENLGVRVPDHALALALIDQCGGWLTGTSANVSGSPSSRTAAEAIRQLGGSVDLILDGGTLAGLESTVVQASGERLAILRTGPVGVPDEMMRRRTS